FGPTDSRSSALRRSFGSAVKRPSTTAANTARFGRKARASSSIIRSPEQIETPRRRSRTTSPKVTGVKPIEENSRNAVRSAVETFPSSRTNTEAGGIETAARPALLSASTTSPSRFRTSAWTRAAADRFPGLESPSLADGGSRGYGHRSRHHGRPGAAARRTSAPERDVGSGRFVPYEGV